MIVGDGVLPLLFEVAFHPPAKRGVKLRQIANLHGVCLLDEASRLVRRSLLSLKPRGEVGSFKRWGEAGITRETRSTFWILRCERPTSSPDGARPFVGDAGCPDAPSNARHPWPPCNLDLLQ